MDILFNVPVNRVSFGQVSISLLKEAFRLGHQVFFQPIGPIDLGSSNPSEEFKTKLSEAAERASLHQYPGMKGFKLWHLAIGQDQLGYMGCYERFCHDTTLLSFYELDAPTKLELNVARNFDTVLTSDYACSVFEESGVKTRFVPLGFDRDNFHVTGKKYFTDDRIVFAIVGKFEQRKHHSKIIQTWVKKFGNDKRYYLQCAIYNPFFNQQINSNLFLGSMGGKHYWNVNPVSWVPTNQAYNDFLNSNNIIVGMSGGEGWGLPEFHSLGLGKHAVILNAHAYKGWANEENAILINPLNKISAVDGLFFKKDIPINQGNIFNWDEEEFIAGCEAAIERYKANPVNKAGLKIQDEFTYEKTFKLLLNL